MFDEHKTFIYVQLLRGNLYILGRIENIYKGNFVCIECTYVNTLAWTFYLEKNTKRYILGFFFVIFHKSFLTILSVFTQVCFSLLLCRRLLMLLLMLLLFCFFLNSLSVLFTFQRLSWREVEYRWTWKCQLWLQLSREPKKQWNMYIYIYVCIYICVSWL